MNHNRILIVDDEAELAEVVSMFLEHSDFDTLTANNGAQALETLKDNPVDLIISDVRMPDGDGEFLLKEVKKIHPSQPAFVFMTAFADLRLPEAYHLGAEAMLAKPIDLSELVQRIQSSILPDGRLWQEDPGTPKTALEVSDSHAAIGRGGIFIQTGDTLPSAGSVVEFRMTSDNPAIPSLSGKGIVRWTREESSSETSRGLGIEFAKLEESITQTLKKYLEETPTIPFIPRDLY